MDLKKRVFAVSYEGVVVQNEYEEIVVFENVAEFTRAYSMVKDNQSSLFEGLNSLAAINYNVNNRVLIDNCIIKNSNLQKIGLYEYIIDSIHDLIFWKNSIFTGLTLQKAIEVFNSEIDKHIRKVMVSEYSNSALAVVENNTSVYLSRKKRLVVEAKYNALLSTYENVRLKASKLTNIDALAELMPIEIL